MSKNLITRYLNYKKKRLVSYALSMYQDNTYLDYEIECLNRYANNYIEVYYHKKFETLDNKTPVDNKAIEQEQEGIRLELLDKLNVREILESNASFIRKKEIINITKKYMEVVIAFDSKLVTPENVEEIITKLITSISQKLPVLQNAIPNWIKKWKETEKTIKKLIVEKQNFILRQVPYDEDLWEVTLLTRVKQINIYKRNLIERVNSESEVEIEKIKLVALILNQIILRDIVLKEKIGNYIVPISENAWSKKEELKELFDLLDDSILKDHVFIGISYNELLGSKKLLEKKQAGYHFACYQDLTYILDIPTKVDTIDSSNLFSYLMITGYKAKDLPIIEKQEPTIMKKIMISKEV